MSLTGRDQVRRCVAASLGDLDDDSAVVVGCSGGADSLALVRAVADLSRRAVVVVVDHGLQDESADVAVQASHQCRALGVDDVRVVRVEVPQGPGAGGLEAAARDARRSALSAVADEIGAPVILLGHTRDDQAETVLLRLARGAGARSLSAIAPVAGRWRRPLLDLPRPVVRDSVSDLAIWDDPHNDDERFARVRVRRTALPALISALGPSVAESLARSAHLLRDDAEALEMWSEQAHRECAVEHDALDVAALAALPRAIRTRILRRQAIESGCPAGELASAHVDRVDQLITDWHGQGALDLPGGIAAERSCGRLSFRRIPTVAQRRRNREET